MPLPRQTVLSQLASFGTLVGHMNQNERIKNHLEAGYLDEGFCRGVCLDWVRRVVQGGKAHFDPREDKDATAKEDKEARQTHRMARAQYVAKVIQDRELIRANNTRAAAINMDEICEKLCTLYNDPKHWVGGAQVKLDPATFGSLRTYLALDCDTIGRSKAL